MSSASTTDGLGLLREQVAAERQEQLRTFRDLHLLRNAQSVLSDLKAIRRAGAVASHATV